MCLHSKLIFVYVGFGVGAREEKRGSEVTNSSIIGLHVMVQWTISWTGSVIGFLFCFVLFFSLSLQDLCSYFLWWTANIPFQAPSIAHTFAHIVWNEEGFYVQGPSITRGIFNVNRLQSVI